jgi:hypothetical protein
MSKVLKETHVRLINLSLNQDNPTTTKILGSVAIKTTLTLTGPTVTYFNYEKDKEVEVKRGQKQEALLNK